MKALRLFVVLLIAVLLPLRGAVAATMVCAEPGQTSEMALAVGAALHGMHGDQADAVGHSHGVAHDMDCTSHVTDHTGQQGEDAAMRDAAGKDASTSSTNDTCHLCAIGCHAAALAATAPVVLGPVLTATVAFPTLSAPAPAFQSDGQERPPRSI